MQRAPPAPDSECPSTVLLYAATDKGVIIAQLRSFRTESKWPGTPRAPWLRLACCFRGLCALN
eukprot:613858-Rhodomonas_salina.2